MPTICRSIASRRFLRVMRDACRHDGVKIERATLAGWVGSGAAELQPLHARLVEMLKASPKLFADETRCPVLDPGRGKTKTGFLWALARDDRPQGFAWRRHAGGAANSRRRSPTASITGMARAAISSCWKHALHDGRIEIDSNTVERGMRGIALNRKNALFAGHDPTPEEGLQRAGPLPGSKGRALHV